MLWFTRELTIDTYGNSRNPTPSLGAHYRLVNVIGCGAMGEVWRAQDTRSGMTVAAKILRPEHMDDPDLIGRFMRERSILMGLRGPGIVDVFDLVVDGGRLGIVMEYVSGGSLRQALQQESTLAPELALRVTERILRALAHAHAQGVIHRDVKPDNVLLSEKWKRTREGDLFLSDFGVAGIVTEGNRMTSSGIIGTPHYMAPEVILNGTADTPGDVYGTGVVLYELLCGRTPFAGPGNNFTVAQRHVSMAPPELPVDPQLWRLLRSLLEKNPDLRPTASHAADTVAALAQALKDAPPLAPASTGGNRLPPGNYRNGRCAAFAAH